MEFKVVIAGLGGQGIIFITRLLAKTAIALGHPVMVAETHGMSQRGGSVVAYLKIGGDEAPLVQSGTADALLALDMDEALRNLPYIRQGGLAFVNTERRLPEAVTEHLERRNIPFLTVPASKLGMDIGSARVANVVLVGFASAHPAFPLSYPVVRERLAIIATGKKMEERNLKALEVGCRVGQI